MDEATKRQESADKKNLKLRTLTGVVYIAILLAFFLLKLFIWIPASDGGSVVRVGNLLFDVLVLALSGIGTWEMLRAFKDKLHISQKVVVMAFSLLVILAYSVSDFVFADLLGIRLPGPGLGSEIVTVAGRNYSMHITFGVMMAGIAVLLSLLVFRHESVSLESTGYSLLALVYPSFFLVVLAVCNHLERYSELALMFIFVTCPIVDALAFFFGRLFGRKLPAKMAPHISPKKTLIGAFGGLIGGAIGAIVVYFFCYGIAALESVGLVHLDYVLSLRAWNLVFYIALGILTSAFSQFGDLVESAIKRKLDIKDMGKILPGHGGVLDRIDSALYAGLIVATAMVVRIMIFG